jgi:hypothetical protein
MNYSHTPFRLSDEVYEVIKVIRMEFTEEELEPRLEEAETGQRALFFVDSPLFARLIFELE